MFLTIFTILTISNFNPSLAMTSESQKQAVVVKEVPAKYDIYLSSYDSDGISHDREVCKGQEMTPLNQIPTDGSTPPSPNFSTVKCKALMRVNQSDEEMSEVEVILSIMSWVQGEDEKALLIVFGIKDLASGEMVSDYMISSSRSKDVSQKFFQVEMSNTAWSLESPKGDSWGVSVSMDDSE